MATQIAYDRGAASLDCHERGHEGSIVVQKVREMGLRGRLQRAENLVQARVNDPTKVVRSALHHAASIASLLLTLEAVTTQIPEKNMDAAIPGMGAGMY